MHGRGGAMGCALLYHWPLAARAKRRRSQDTMAMDLKQLTDLINQFVTDKGWYAEHSIFPQTPRNIATSVVVEAAELLEHFQFSDAPKDTAALAGELADVANYLFQLAYLLDIDLEQAILDKLKVNYDRTWE
jgi:NTP pyrophosphatase (non-canonical NTP hydrolase)